MYESCAQQKIIWIKAYKTLRLHTAVHCNVPVYFPKDVSSLLASPPCRRRSPHQKPLLILLSNLLAHLRLRSLGASIQIADRGLRRLLRRFDGRRPLLFWIGRVANIDTYKSRTLLTLAIYTHIIPFIALLRTMFVCIIIFKQCCLMIIQIEACLFNPTFYKRSHSKGPK